LHVQLFCGYLVGSINHNGPAIKRAERLETALRAVLAKEPACRGGLFLKIKRHGAFFAPAFVQKM
jgi:hypothetical protein